MHITTVIGYFRVSARVISRGSTRRRAVRVLGITRARERDTTVGPDKYYCLGIAIDLAVRQRVFGIPREERGKLIAQRVEIRFRGTVRRDP